MTATASDQQAFLDDMIRQLCIANEINPVVLVSPPPFYPIPYPMKIVTTTTSDQQALLAAIEVEPDNLTLRLVYADWLDERQAGGRCEPCRGSGYRFCPRCSGEGCSVYGIAANGRCLADDKCDDCSGSGRVSNGFGQLACDQRLYVAAQAVIARPDEDGPRLEYAKIAEVYGRGERGEFIRVQCELARIPLSPYCTCQDRFVPHDEECPFAQWALAGWYGKHILLYEREKELLEKNRHKWFSLGNIKPWSNTQDDVCWVTTGGTNNNGYLGGKVRRGFVSEVRTTLTEWLTHGPAICREHPVQPHAGMVTDVRPWPHLRGQASWCRGPHLASYEGGRHIVPCEIFQCLNGAGNSDVVWYDTEEAAMLDLSRACIKWARGERR
jgi:uncharacterized protein (TIGR02996 family)